MVFLWKLSGSSLYPWYFTGAYLGMGLFIIYFVAYSVGFSFQWFWTYSCIMSMIISFLLFFHSQFLEFLLLDVELPQLILQFSHLWSTSSSCYSAS